MQTLTTASSDLLCRFIALSNTFVRKSAKIKGQLSTTTTTPDTEDLRPFTSPLVKHGPHVLFWRGHFLSIIHSTL